MSEETNVNETDAAAPEANAAAEETTSEQSSVEKVEGDQVKDPASSEVAYDASAIQQLLDHEQAAYFSGVPEEDKTITGDFFVALKDAAAEAIKAAEEVTISAEQLAHLQSIVSGFLPFGFKLV
jgi:predicted class III extradiol MEMO1 family dioxygenase